MCRRSDGRLLEKGSKDGRESGGRGTGGFEWDWEGLWRAGTSNYRAFVDAIGFRDGAVHGCSSSWTMSESELPRDIQGC